MRNKDFAGWVTATCRKCGSAFQIYDKYGDYNEVPPTKFYCPKCEKLGFKNIKHKETPSEFLKANGITDKIVIREFKKRIKNFKRKRLDLPLVLRDAIEIAEIYKKEK